jgi:hypothetical protein
MPRVHPINKKAAAPAIKIALERQSHLYNDPVSNMQATLAHSLPAFETYMQWHGLFEEVQKIVGRRQSYILAYAISKGSSCTYCETVFRKKLADIGEDADTVRLTEEEKELASFGEAAAKCHGNIANHLFNSLAKKYFTEELVIITAFTGQMIAANIFNNLVETDVDGHLEEYIPSIKRLWA